MHDATRLAHSGRNSEAFHGAVNTPVFRASTILAPTLKAWEERLRARAEGEPGVYYGRLGTPTTQAFESSVALMEGAHRALVFPSGLAACTTALLSTLSAGDHLLMTDSVYGPVRHFCDRTLRRMGIETTYYDPLIGSGVGALFRANTRAVYVESPGSQTLEVQDVPAIARQARGAGIRVIMDNTWATPLYFKPFELGVDLSIQAATKYIVGHSDALIGTVGANEANWPALVATAHDLGQTAGPDDVYLAHRGMRTMAVRLARHWTSGLEIATWLQSRPEVARVIHPALPGDAGHALWSRDFRGACGLFSIVLHEVDAAALARFVDSLELFGIGTSWGGYESLVLPFDPRKYRTATRWNAQGPCLRFHIGLEEPSDLIRDLACAFERMRSAAA
jgi:cystathionine beta-lyase